MGILGLWEVIREQDRTVPIAQLATDHLKKHGRPLRIAVDEADWRFHNLNSQQVFTIREKSNQPAYQGIEKLTFYRLCRYLALNIQFILVFDGSHRPAKRGRNGGTRIDYEARRLLKEMLGQLRIPYHEAPGEAEAECARLQFLGIVDAVWSTDSDTLMFGCDFLIRDHRVAGQNGAGKNGTVKSKDYVHIVKAHEIREAHKLDREGLVLFAMLAGGDYNTKGLQGCGNATALRAVQAGFGKSLCACRTQLDCVRWRQELLFFFQCASRTRQLDIPPNFPDIKILKKYNSPHISMDEQLRSLRGLHKGWDQQFDELKLLELTSSRFNIWGRLYMNWIGPILLAKSLVAVASGLPAIDPSAHQIRLVKQRKRKDQGQPLANPLERKLTFSPFRLTTLVRGDFEGERAGYWTSIAEDQFDPDYRVECQILECLLPPELLVAESTAAKTKPQKRKRRADFGDDVLAFDTDRPRKKRKPQAKKQPTDAAVFHTNSVPHPRKAESTTRTPVLGTNVIDLISDDEHSDALEEMDFHSSPSSSAHSGHLLQSACSNFPITSAILRLEPELDDLEIDRLENAQLTEAVRLSLRDQTSTPKASVSQPTTGCRREKKVEPSRLSDVAGSRRPFSVLLDGRWPSPLPHAPASTAAIQSQSSSPLPNPLGVGWPHLATPAPASNSAIHGRRSLTGHIPLDSMSRLTAISSPHAGRSTKPLLDSGPVRASLLPELQDSNKHSNPSLTGPTPLRPVTNIQRQHLPITSPSKVPSKGVYPPHADRPCPTHSMDPVHASFLRERELRDLEKHSTPSLIDSAPFNPDSRQQTPFLSSFKAKAPSTKISSRGTRRSFCPFRSMGPLPIEHARELEEERKKRDFSRGGSTILKPIANDGRPRKPVASSFHGLPKVADVEKMAGVECIDLTGD